MELSEIWSLLLLEALFLSVLMLIVVLVLYLRLRRSSGRKPAAAAAPDYGTWLDREIQQATVRLDSLNEQESEADPGLRQLVDVRLRFLNAERDAVRCDQARDEAFWSSLAETLAGFTGQGGTTPTQTLADQSAMIEVLQSRLQTYQVRVANLEKFKDHFFDLKGKYANTRELNEQLHSEVVKALPEDAQSPELKDTLQKLKLENAMLEEQLTLIEREFDDIMRNISPDTRNSGIPEQPETSVGGSMDNIDSGIGRIKAIIANQEQQIADLRQTISELQLEVEDKQRLQQLFDELQAKSDEFSNITAILEEENLFLQEQVAALLKQELEKTEDYEGRIRELEQLLLQKERAFADLESKYASMEQESMKAWKQRQQGGM